jgi:Domain of unknown function (DUF4335)
VTKTAIVVSGYHFYKQLTILINFMVSLVKRYAPPTLSLEIVGKVSPLSIYLQKPTLKELYFQLNFDDPRLSSEKKITVRGDRTLLDSLCNAVRDYVQNFLTQPNISSNITKLPTSSSQPYLHPQGVTNHKLHLGKVNEKNTPQSILLSAVQLFDLANALEEYSQEIATLSESYRGQGKKVIPIVATGFILALGLTIGVKMSPHSPTPPQSDTPSNSTTTKITPIYPKKPLSDVIPPQPSQITSITPAIIPQPLQQREKLSPPQPVTRPPIPKISQVNPDTPPQPAEFVIIPQVKPQPPQTISPKKPSLSINPPSKVENTIQIEKKPPSLVLKSPTVVPTFQDNSQENIASETNFNNNNLLGTQELTITPSKEEEKPPENIAKPSLEETASLFDYTPQIAEVREYFQENWQSPENLQQTLQYLLVINKNGHLQTVIPLGTNAEFYLKQVKFPLNSESFVSPLSEESTQTIRLVLQPDGPILTFLEN